MKSLCNNLFYQFFLMLVLLCATVNSRAETFYKLEQTWPSNSHNWSFQEGICSSVVDKSGNINVLNINKNYIRKYTPKGYLLDETNISSILGTERSGEQFSLDSSGNTYITNDFNDKKGVHVINENGDVLRHIDEDRLNNKIIQLYGITLDNEDNIYITGKFEAGKKLLVLNSSYKVINQYTLDNISANNFSTEYTIRGNIIYDDEYVYFLTQGYDDSRRYASILNRINTITGSINKVVYIESYDFINLQPISLSGFTIDRSSKRIFIATTTDIGYLSKKVINISIYNFNGENLSSYSHDINISYYNNETIFCDGYAITYDHKNKLLLYNYSKYPRIYIYNDSKNGISLLDAWGDTHLTKVTDIHKHGNTLYILDRNYGVSVLDLGFNLLDLINVKNPYSLSIYNSSIYITTNGLEPSISKFNMSGELMTKFGVRGEDLPGTFYRPTGVVAHRDTLYITDLNGSFQSFDTDGNVISRKDNFSLGSKNYHNFQRLSLDKYGYLYTPALSKSGASVILKLDLDGELEAPIFSDILQSQLYRINDVEFDSAGNIYLVDTGYDISHSGIEGNNVLVFNEAGNLITSVGAYGSLPTQLKNPEGLYVDDERIYIADTGNRRVVVYKKVDRPDNSKAIIIAGGTTTSDPLWDEVQANAHHAFYALASQGYTKDNIYYLNANTDIDLDNNGKPDDVDDKPTLENIRKAITEWAANGENVVIYMIDHGGDQTYQLNASEIMKASQLSQWLDTLQSQMSGKLTVIYDACASGTFLSVLANSGYDRTVITSTTGNENASFNDAISFSNLFWSQIFNGKSIAEAFELTRNSISASYNQHPLLDSTDNGIGNEAIDLSSVEQQYIGSGITNNGTAPTIDSVLSTSVEEGESTSTFTAYGVQDKEGITSVWGVVRPPYADLGQSGTPVQNLPRFNLSKQEDDSYQGSFDGFDQPGSYNIAIYAQDKEGNTSFPQTLTVVVENPLSRKAIIVAGVDARKQSTPLIQKQAEYAYEVLKSQGYASESIKYLSAQSVATGEVDFLATAERLKFEIQEWAKNNTADIVVYLIGDLKDGQFAINQGETISTSQLDIWLDGLQNKLSGLMTIIHEGDYSAHLITALTPPDNKQRIVISSSSLSEKSHALADGNISFSRYFWNQVRQGSTISRAFIYAQAAMGRYQSPQLNDNGNKVSNEKTDRRVARLNKLGVGILLAADEPKIQSIAPDVTLNGDGNHILWVEGIVSTAQIAKVWAVVTPPEFNPILSQTPDQYELQLIKTDDNKWEVTHNEFNKYMGEYRINHYAIDVNNRVSQPITGYVIQSTGPDAYEVDNHFETAKDIQTTSTDPQWHNFHEQDDIDYIRFEVKASNGQYTIRVDATGSEADPVLELYDSNQAQLQIERDLTGAGEEELRYFTPESDGFYYLKVRPFQTTTTQWPELTGYKVSVFPTNGELQVTLSGYVTNEAGTPIQGAIVRTSVSGRDTTNASGYYTFQTKSGDYDLMVEASGYYKQIKTLSTETNDEQAHDFEMKVDTEYNPIPPIVTTIPVIQSGRLSTTTVKQNDKNVVMHILKIAVPEGGADLQSIKVKASGSGDEANDVKRVTLYHDINKNGVIDSGDELLSEKQFSSDNGTILFELATAKHFDVGNMQLVVGYDF